ncbi:hypothetical protein HOT31_gp031 [Microbacterium phage Hendrix]|uniref:Uncharacterized protein n=1 Tax=Microbacterium phage Hendrix TaxID=2182341 RepID=A0A2U8UUF6_9CAUD|nr:hypothetical protein HOT31_gp031 [Microbacterium phage Hendrix]AWN07702.1 hypothetical protein PBI_HENDRIX_31 [Microbacterium phage Hendrix]
MSRTDRRRRRWRRLWCKLTSHRWHVTQIWPPEFECLRCGTSGRVPGF